MGKVYRKSGTEYFVGKIHCVYCFKPQFTPEIMHHLLSCIERLKVEKLTTEQSFVEIVLYVFGYVPQIRGNVIFDEENKKFALKLYEFIKSFKLNWPDFDFRTQFNRVNTYVERNLRHLNGRLKNERPHIIKDIEVYIKEKLGDKWIYEREPSDVWLHPITEEDGFAYEFYSPPFINTIY